MGPCHIPPWRPSIFASVTYSNQSKVDVWEAQSPSWSMAVSAEVRQEMAVGARRTGRADYGVSVTGIAGPGGSAIKPTGMACFVDDESLVGGEALFLGPRSSQELPRASECSVNV